MQEEDARVPPPPFDANAATLVLRVLESLGNVPSKGNAATALALAMPFSGVVDDYSVGLRRCLIMLDAVGHLEVIASANAALPKAHVVPVIKEVKALFTDGLRALDADRRWFLQTLKPETTRGLAFIEHNLPKDRYALLAADHEYLLGALTSLRRAQDSAGPVVRDLLAEYVLSLEEALLKATVKGSRPIAEILFHWKISHDIAYRKSPVELDAIDSSTREVINGIVAKSRSALDDILRAAGAVDLIGKLLPLIPNG